MQIATRTAVFVVDLMMLCRQPGSGNGYKVRTYGIDKASNYHVLENARFLYDWNSCLILCCLVLPCVFLLSCLVLSCLVLSYLDLSYLVLCCLVLSWLFIFCFLSLLIIWNHLILIIIIPTVSFLISLPLSLSLSFSFSFYWS